MTQTTGQNETQDRTVQGCGTALITPFNADGSVDGGALADLVEFQISEGIHFLVPCGTTGETPSLSGAEQRQVVGTVVRQADGRVPIVAGAGGNNTASVIESAKAMRDLGADAILSVAPYYNKPNQEGLFQHFSAIADQADVPIVLYNVPGRTGSNIAPKTVLRLAEHPRVIGIKEASANVAQMTAIAVDMPAGFRLLSGDDGFVLPLVAIGGCGVISVVANIVPGEMTRFTQHCLEGSFAHARRLQRRIHELTRACFLETNPIPVKAALAMMGRIQEVYRLPMVQISEASRQKLTVILEQEDVLKDVPRLSAAS